MWAPPPKYFLKSASKVWSINTAGRRLPLHAGNPISIPWYPKWSPEPARNDFGVQSQESVLRAVGCGPKAKPNQTRRVSRARLDGRWVGG